MKETRLENPKSTTPMKIDTITDAIITITVEPKSSLREGQVTLPNSNLTSLRN